VARESTISCFSTVAVCSTTRVERILCRNVWNYRSPNCNCGFETFIISPTFRAPTMNMKTKYMIPSIQSTSNNVDLVKLLLRYRNTLYEVKANTTDCRTSKRRNGVDATHAYWTVLVGISYRPTPSKITVIDDVTSAVDSESLITTIPNITKAIINPRRNTRIARLLSHIAHVLNTKMSSEHMTTTISSDITTL